MATLLTRLRSGKLTAGETERLESLLVVDNADPVEGTSERDAIVEALRASEALEATQSAPLLARLESTDVEVKAAADALRRVEAEYLGIKRELFSVAASHQGQQADLRRQLASQPATPAIGELRSLLQMALELTHRATIPTIKIANGHMGERVQREPVAEASRTARIDAIQTAIGELADLVLLRSDELPGAVRAIFGAIPPLSYTPPSSADAASLRRRVAEVAGVSL